MRAKFPRYRHLAPWLVLAIGTTLLLLALRLPPGRLDVPYQFEGDALDKLAQIKNVAETGWLFHNDRLGFPFGYDRLDFPRFDSLNYALMAPFAWLLGPEITINLYFVAGFYLVAFAAFWCLRRLRIDAAPAVIASLAYAFLPYHVLRGVAHLTNGAYFLIPFAMLVATWLALDEIDGEPRDARKRWIFALAVAVLVPLQTPYNGVFFAYVLGVACIIALARNPRLRTVVVTLSLLAAIAGAFVVEQVPVFLRSLEAGKPALVAERMPVEAEIYSMRLNQLLMPTLADRRAPARRAALRFDDAMSVPLSEVRNQYLGALGIAGFFALMFSLCRAVATNDPREADAAFDTERAVRIAAVFALAILLLAISTGFGTLISYWITSKIRAWNRVLPFFAFACFVGAAWLLELMFRRVGKPALRNAIIAAVAVVTLHDVLVRPTDDRVEIAASVDEGRAFFADVERRLGNGAAVFQLPATWYPEHAPINEMGDYEEFQPWLFTRTLRFSYGVGHGRIGYNWNKYASDLAPNDAVRKIHAMGFSAILIDSLAYDAQSLAKLVDGFSAALSEPPSISPTRRWWLFSLAGCCDHTAEAKLALQPGARAFDYAPGSASIRFTSGGDGVLYAAGGWLDPEPWGTWGSGTHSALRLRLNPRPPGSIAVEIDTRMLISTDVPKRTLSVVANAQPAGRFVYDMQSGGSRKIRIELPPDVIGDDGLLELAFDVFPKASPLSAGVSVDARDLGIGIVELSITPVADGAH